VSFGGEGEGVICKLGVGRGEGGGAFVSWRGGMCECRGGGRGVKKGYVRVEGKGRGGSMLYRRAQHGGGLCCVGMRMNELWYQCEGVQHRVGCCKMSACFRGY